MRFLVAGLTGQLGHGVATVSAGNAAEIVPVARRISRLDAKARLAGTFRDQPALAEAAVTGDVTQTLWGIDPRLLDRLAPRIDAVVNLAAETNWVAPRRRLRAVNTLGARHGLAVAQALRARHPRCAAYLHASTIYTAGGQVGSIAEERFPPDADRTDYEHSKWLAEEFLLSQTDAGVAIGVARIGGLLGDSVTGHTVKRNSLYLLAAPGRAARFLPVTAHGRLDMLPRDMAAQSLLDVACGLVRLASPAPQLVHVCAGETAPALAEVIAGLRRIDPLGLRPRPRLVPVPERLVFRLSTDLSRLVPLRPRVQLMLEGLRYIVLDRVFERDRLVRFLGGEPPAPSAELIARLAFDVPGRPGNTVREIDRPFARFA